MPLPSNARRLCHAMNVFSAMLLLSLPIIHLYHWWASPSPALLIATGLSPTLIPADYDLGLLQRANGLLASGVLVMAMMWSLWQARRAFRLFLAGNLFGDSTILAVHRFALGIVLTTTIAIIEPLWMSALLTQHLPATHRHIVFHLGSGQLFMLIVAALFWTLTYLMKRGAELTAENEQFV